MDNAQTNSAVLFTNIDVDLDNCTVKYDKLDGFDFHQIYMKDTLIAVTCRDNILIISITNVGQAEIDLRNNRIKLTPLGATLFGVNPRPTDSKYEHLKIITFVANDNEFRIELEKESSNIVHFNIMLLELGSNKDPIRVSFDLDTTNLLNKSSCCSR